MNNFEEIGDDKSYAQVNDKMYRAHRVVVNTVINLRKSLKEAKEAKPFLLQKIASDTIIHQLRKELKQAREEIERLKKNTVKVVHAGRGKPMPIVINDEITIEESTSLNMTTKSPDKPSKMKFGNETEG